MLRLQPVPMASYRPYAAIARRLAAPAPQMGQTLSPVALGVGLLIDVGISGAVSWVGFYAGNNARGLLSILGYGVGIVGGLGVLGGLIDGGLLLFGKTPGNPYVKAPAPVAAPSEATTVPA